MTASYPNDSKQPPFPPFDPPPPDDPAYAPLRTGRGLHAGLLVTLVIIALVVGPLVYFGWPAEIAKWRIAAAEQKRLKGDLPGALAELDDAIQSYPNDPQLLLRRARYRIEQNDFEGALQDAELAVQLRPNSLEARGLRCEAYQYLGRHAEAIAEWKRIVRRSDTQHAEVRSHMLNGLAYARALGNMEINEALVDIDEAIRLGGENHGFIDTRGYLYYRQGDLERALSDLDSAVASAEDFYEVWSSVMPGRSLAAPDARDSDVTKKMLAREVAVIRYHRALIHDKRGDEELAKKDYQRVRELGFEPDDSLF